MVERATQQPDKPRIFADEETRWGYEVAEKVSELVNRLPPEGPRLNIQRITFEGFKREDRIRGLSAVFTAGTSWGTGEKGVLAVPQRTIDVLNELKLPFRFPPSSK